MWRAQEIDVGDGKCYSKSDGQVGALYNLKISSKRIYPRVEKESSIGEAGRVAMCWGIIDVKDNMKHEDDVRYCTST